jgi:hypothetical protein
MWLTEVIKIKNKAEFPGLILVTFYILVCNSHVFSYMTVISPIRFDTYLIIMLSDLTVL